MLPSWALTDCVPWFRFCAGPPSHRLPAPAALQKLPRVDVGSLEEVISRMEADEKGDWGDVVFVPAKSVAGAAGNAK